MEKEFSMCRPIPGYYCLACCRNRQCSNFGPLPDLTWGCLGYRGDTSLGGNPQSEFCQSVYCLDGRYTPEGEILNTPKNIQIILNELKTRPPGEFSISELTRTLGLYIPKELPQMI